MEKEIKELKEAITKVKEAILESVGYIDITKIKIPEEFKRTKPKYKKLQEKKMFFVITGKFMEPIVIDKANVLVDGYTSYLLANWNYYKYVKVKRRV